MSLWITNLAAVGYIMYIVVICNCKSMNGMDGGLQQHRVLV